MNASLSTDEYYNEEDDLPLGIFPEAHHRFIRGGVRTEPGRVHIQERGGVVHPLHHSDPEAVAGAAVRDQEEFRLLLAR